MASFTSDAGKVKNEFSALSKLYEKHKINHVTFDTLSMGMSNDYNIAVEAGSNMVRIGSLIFGSR